MIDTSTVRAECNKVMGEEIHKIIHILIFSAAIPLTATGAARLLGPEHLCASVAAGLIQTYCDKISSQHKQTKWMYRKCTK